MEIYSCAFVCGPCRARRGDIFKYRRCFVQSQFLKNDLEAKQSWTYAVLLMSVGPVGPGGGIYPIIYDVVCKINFQKLIWRPNNRGYMQLCPCLWALSLFFLNILCTQHTLYLNISHLRANSCGYMQLCLCLWALMGPEVEYI